MKSQMDYDGSLFFSNNQTLIPKKKQKGTNELEILMDTSYTSRTMSYARQSVQGFLKKRVQEVKFWQKKVKPKRYFVIDHVSFKLRIY